MEYQITVEPSGRQFSVRADQTIVAAALEQGIAIHHGCGNGSCGDCKGTVLAGDFIQLPYMPLLLTPAERARGMAILCKVRPCSDLRIAAQIDVPQLWEGQIHSLERLSSSVLELQVQVQEDYPYQAGQYTRIALPTEPKIWRSYSMATPPRQDRILTFHIRYVPGGRFSSWFFQQAKPLDVLQLSGPQGEFFLRQDNDRPLLCIAAGTGLAPIEAILEESLQLGWQRPVTLFFGVRQRQDFYHLEKLQEWSTRHPHLSCIPTLSDLADREWTGARRLLPTVAQHGPWQGHEAYLCGSPGMIEAAIDLLLSHGLPSSQIHFDSFAPNG